MDKEEEGPSFSPSFLISVAVFEERKKLRGRVGTAEKSGH